MVHKEQRTDSTFQIDRQGYDAEDANKKRERVDVSPSGTEGIFIDIDLPEEDDGENDMAPEFNPPGCFVKGYGRV